VKVAKFTGGVSRELWDEGATVRLHVRRMLHRQAAEAFPLIHAVGPITWVAESKATILEFSAFAGPDHLKAARSYRAFVRSADRLS
jgi:hypothetical protein